MKTLREELRVRFTPGRIAVAAGLIAGFLAVVALVQSDEHKVPTDHAADLVPANTLAYVHATVDTGSGQWKDAAALVRRIPRLARLRDRALRGLTTRGARLDLEHQVYPWLGDEAAFALLPGTGGQARSLILLEVSDKLLARDFLARAVGHVRKAVYRGVGIELYGRLATAFLGDFLAIGRIENVRAAIDAWQGRTDSLAAAPALARARGSLPKEGRLVFAYASRPGVKRVLNFQPGPVGRIVKLIDEPRLEAAAATLKPEKSGLLVDFASVLRRKRFEDARERPFPPKLLEVVPRDAIAYFGERGADRIFERVSAVVGRNALSLPAALRRLGAQVAGKQGARLRRAARPLLQEEAALFVSPSDAAPLITLVVNGVDREEAGQLIERFQPLLSKLIQRPTAGQVPTFQPRRIGNLDAATLAISPSLSLTYSIFGGRAVLSTSPQGIRDAGAVRSSIRDNPLFDSNLLDSRGSASSILFLDLEQLLALGEQAGLGETSSYRAFKTDFSGVDAVSAVTQNKPASRQATIFIEVK
jgi:uncharacterized protein DUF3352